jgi:type IV pilus assembly protein PilX
MNLNNSKFNTGSGKAAPGRQRGVSLIVALVMLIVLTLIGVSSMNTAIVELKMAGSAQQQGIAQNRANELLRVGEDRVVAIVTDPLAFDFSAGGDGYYAKADNIDVHDIQWADNGLSSVPGAGTGETYIAEYLGDEEIPGESRKEGTDGRIIGGAVHTFRITSRAAAGKSALRLVQSIYVTTSPP